MRILRKRAVLERLRHQQDRLPRHVRHDWELRPVNISTAPSATSKMRWMR